MEDVETPLMNFSLILITLPFIVNFIIVYAVIWSLLSLLCSFVTFFLHVIALVRCSHSFSRFQYVVENYDKFDAGTKNAILKASSSVASIISRIGDKVIFIGSGTIIKCDAHDGCFYGTILTSATFLQGPAGEASVLPNLKIDVYLLGGNLCKGQVLTYDFHYNIATIKVKSDSPLSTAKIRYIDDTIAIDSDMSAIAEANSFMHYGEGAASTRFNLCPGELVIALSRFSEEPHEIMAAPGLFSCDDCPHDCKELYLTTCTVNKAAVGGPLVNCYGEVIGVNFISCPFNAFLPINIAFKCLEDLNKNRRVPRPWLGVSISNLYTAKLEKLDGLPHKFPHVVKGVIIDKVKSRRVNTCMEKTKALHWTFWSSRKWLKAKVINQNIRKLKRTQKRVRKMKVKQESPASVAGLCADDVIISCDGKSIGGQLELIETLWNKEGKAVELVVVRPETGQRSLTVTIGTSPKMNKWHVPLVGFLPTLEDRLAVERRDKMKVDEME